MYAASHGHMDAALALAEQFGANVLHEDSRRSNAIMYADAAGYASIAQALREASDCRALRKADARSTAPISAHEESSPQGPHRRDEYAPAPSPPTQSHEDPQSFTLPTTTPQNSPSKDKRKSGVRVINSHLPRKVSTPPTLDNMPPGPCAEGGGLWIIVEDAEH